MKRFTLDLDAYVAGLSQASVDETLIQLAMLYPLGTTCRTRLTIDEKLAAAMRALDSFDLVGVKEELVDFTCMLDASMGWPAKPLDHVNVTSKRVALDAAQMRALKKVLEPEIELYQHALTRFREDRRKFISPVCDTTVPAFIRHTDTRPVGGPLEKHTGDSVTPEVKNFGDKRCEITSVSVAGKITGFQRVMALCCR